MPKSNAKKVLTLSARFPILPDSLKQSEFVIEIWNQRESMRVALERIRDIAYKSQAHNATETVLACIRIAEESLL